MHSLRNDRGARPDKGSSNEICLRMESLKEKIVYLIKYTILKWDSKRDGFSPAMHKTEVVIVEPTYSHSWSMGGGGSKEPTYSANI